MSSKAKPNKRKRKSKTFTLKNIDKQVNMNYVDILYENGDYDELLKLLLIILPNTIVKLNNDKGCIELYINETGIPEFEKSEHIETLTEFEMRIKHINSNLSKEQQKFFKKYKELNYDNPVDYSDEKDEDEYFVY